MNVGDLVKIRPGVDDEEIPENRMGIVIRVWSNDLRLVHLSNGMKIDFSPYWLILINGAETKQAQS